MIFRKEGQEDQVIMDSNPRRIKAEDELREAIEREDYERAAIVRDRIKSRRESKKLDT